MNTPFNPVVTVITIVYNNVTDIERTILSVINQSYKNIEYIIIDGASTDGTLAIIKQYESKISNWISEKDKGIYDAMNKGLAIAKGDYVLFMNSGDEIYNRSTVERIFESIPDADIYYGETEMYDKNWESLGRRRHEAPDKFNWRSFKFGMSVSHQAIYIKKEITVPYDEHYQLSADVDWIIKAAKKAKLTVKVPGYVAKYLVGGISKKRQRESLKERYQIFKKHYGFLPNLFNHGIIAIKLIWYYIKNRRTND